MITAGACFLILLVCGLPIAFALGLTGVIHLFTIEGTQYFTVIAPRLYDGINMISLTCIPFFIIAGEIMNGGGVTERLIDFMRELVGFLRGGLAYTTVFVSMILAAILGSANAVASIMGAVMVPELRKDGYEDAYAGALISAAGILGPIIPPSTTFVLYSTLSNTSIKSLFMAGIIPGILIGLGYVLLIFFTAKKRNFPKSDKSFNGKKLFKSFIYAIPALAVPFVILGGIMTGMFTPTESGAVAVVVAFLAGLFYKSLDIKKVPEMLLRSGIVTAGIFLIMAFGNIIGWSMAMDGIPAKITSTILGFTNSKTVIILIVFVLLIIIGCFMEATAALLIFTPVFLPLMTQIGMDPIHFGLFFCIMIVIGLATPPVGMVLFVTSNVTGIKLSSLCKEIWPFVVTALIVTLALAFMPDVVLFLPRMLGT